MKEGDVFESVFTVTPEVYEGFINTFRDRNPLHTDEAFAKEKGFSSVVMHGGILTGFLSNFIGEQLPLKNVIIHSYKISFAKPVYLGTQLLFKATITGVFESVNSVTMKYSFSDSKNTVSKGEITIGII